MSLRRILVSSFLLLAILAGTSFAGDPNVVFKGKIMTSTKRYPLSAKSKDSYIAAIKKQSTTNFQEDKEKQQWKIYFAAFLTKPLNDVEYMIKFYDITGGQQQMMGAAEQFNDTRGQKTIVSSIVLDKKSFGVNKQLMMTIESNGKILASARFKILGEGEKFTGKVNFSEDEANGNGGDQ